MSELKPDSSRLTGVGCGACGGWADESAGEIPFYLPGSSIVTALWKCRACGTYIRQLDYDQPAIRAHFDVASYTAVAAEARWRRLRTALFEYVLQLATLHLGRPLAGLRALDWGTAYGIMLELMHQAEMKPEGVEIVAALREQARSRGFQVHESVEALSDRSCDLITAIDSFYYANDPALTLAGLARLLRPEGVLIARLTNRTWYFDLRRALGMSIPPARFDDVKYNFSVKGAARLLERSGFDIESIYWSDKGRGDDRPAAALYYRLAPLASRFLSLRVSPGMIVVARPARKAAKL